MKAVVTDADALTAVSPQDAVAYLRAHGWDWTGERRTGSVWARRLEDGDAVRVFVPRDRDFADYAQRLSEVLGTIADVERRSQLEVLADLTSASSDVVRIRVVSAATAAGRIPLSTGVKIVESARALMMAAACSARDPQPVYDFRQARDAWRHVADGVLLGSEPPSSYAISIVSPLPADQSASVNQPFARTVTRALFSAMGRVQATVRDVIANPRELSRFSQHVQSGVSSNLCDAIADMDTGQRDGVVEFGFTWSPLQPDPALEARRFAIRQEELPVIRRAAEFLKAAEPRPGFQVEGLIVRLDRSGRPTVGTATLRALVDGRPTFVHARLSRDQYDVAGSAHLRARRVRLTGLLVSRRGRAAEYDLLNITEIVLAPLSQGTET